MLNANNTEMNRMGPIGCGGIWSTMALALHALGVALKKLGEVSISVRKGCVSGDGGTFLLCRE